MTRPLVECVPNFSEGRDLDKIGIELLPPDVNKSTAEFTVEMNPDAQTCNPQTRRLAKQVLRNVVEGKTRVKFKKVRGTED